MKTLLRRLGVWAYWATYPGLLVYLRGKPRTRVLIRAEGKLLVVKGWLSSGHWALPGGGLHRGEAPLTGLLREVAEETGLHLQPGQVRPLFQEEYRYRGARFPCHYFIADLPRLLPLRPQILEISDAEWLPPESLTLQNANPDVLAALSRL